MARIRSVHPDICLSETMAGVSAELERTFVRLWTHCDDKGRCIDNPRLIKAALFPLHDDVTAATIDAHLSALWRAGLVTRYSVGSESFLQVDSWAEYQHPKHPSPSKCPEPTGEHLPPTGETLPASVPETTQGVVEGEGVGEGGGGPLPELSVAEQVRYHRWADNVTNDEVDEALFVLRSERIPEMVLIEALALAEAFPSKWKTQARRLHAERRPAPSVRSVCGECGTSGFVLNDAGDAVPCPSCRQPLEATA